MPHLISIKFKQMNKLAWSNIWRGKSILGIVTSHLTGAISTFHSESWRQSKLQYYVSVVIWLDEPRHLDLELITVVQTCPQESLTITAISGVHLEQVTSRLQDLLFWLLIRWRKWLVLMIHKTKVGGLTNKNVTFEQKYIMTSCNI